MKIYVASSFLNKDAVRKVEKILRDNGYTVTSKWVDHVGGQGCYAILQQEGMTDMLDLLIADTILVLWPGRLGTASELGMALGLAKQVFVVSDGSPIDMPFAYLPQVQHVKSVYEFMERTGCLPWQEGVSE